MRKNAKRWIVQLDQLDIQPPLQEDYSLRLVAPLCNVCMEARNKKNERQESVGKQKLCSVFFQVLEADGGSLQHFLPKNDPWPANGGPIRMLNFRPPGDPYGSIFYDSVSRSGSARTAASDLICSSQRRSPRRPRRRTCWSRPSCGSRARSAALCRATGI